MNEAPQPQANSLKVSESVPYLDRRCFTVADVIVFCAWPTTTASHMKQKNKTNTIILIFLELTSLLCQLNQKRKKKKRSNAQS